MIELLELKETLKGHLVQFPCAEQGHLQFSQVAQSNPSLTLSVSGDETSDISEQPLPVPHHTDCKNLLPYNQSPLF